MTLIAKQNFIVENIFDEKGNILGQIKFNPNDSRIMSRLAKCMNDLKLSIEEMDKIGDIHLSAEELKTTDDLYRFSEDIDKASRTFEIEEKAIQGIIDDLSDIFGKDTIEIFTGGTCDVELLNPLLEFVMPYVHEYRNNKVEKYLPKQEEVFVLE